MSADSTNLQSCSTTVFTVEKALRVSGPAQLKTRVQGSAVQRKPPYEREAMSSGVSVIPKCPRIVGHFYFLLCISLYFSFSIIHL